MNNLTQRIITGLIAAAIAITGIVVSEYGLALLCVLASLLGLWEYLSLVGIKQPIYTVSAIAAAAVSWTGIFLDLHLFPLALLLLPYIGMLLLREQNMEAAFPIFARWMFGFIYVVVPFLCIYQVAFLPDGSYDWQIPLFIVIINYTSDTIAYFTGRFFGKHLFAPTISPKKTWEGTAGGFVAALTTGLVIYFFSGNTSLNWLVVTLIIAFFNQPGDLIESLIKRSVNAKDSGKLMPGHGGMLDRIDSFLIIFPIIYAYWAMRG